METIPYTTFRSELEKAIAFDIEVRTYHTPPSVSRREKQEAHMYVVYGINQALKAYATLCNAEHTPLPEGRIQ